MRPAPLLVLLASLTLATGCQLGGKSKGWQADATPRKKETWNAPRFESRNDARRTEHARALERAHTAAREDRLVEARLLFARVLEEDPGNASAHHGLAILADRQQDFVTAETHYLAALEANPEDPDLLNDVGYSYLLQKRHSEAKQLFVKALEIDPRHELATSNLGHLHAQTGRYDDALMLFRQVGTEEQAQAEIARYTSRQTPPGREELAGWETEPDPMPEIAASPDDLQGLSFEQMQAVRERARLAGVQARRDRERTEARPFENTRNPLRDDGQRLRIEAVPGREEFAGQRREAPPFDPGFGEPLDDPSRRQPTNPVQPIGFETTEPAPFEIGDSRPTSEPFDRRGGSEFDSTRSLPNAAPEFGAPAAEFWPPEESRPADRSLGANAPRVTPPPWPGANGQRMGDRMTTGVQPHTQPPADAAGPVIRPNPIRQRAAILGMNAASGLPIPIESSGPRTAHHRHAFEEPQPRPVTSPGRVRPRVDPPANSPSDGFGAPSIPEQWPDAELGSTQPISTTAPVPSDPSLYRTATGAPLTADDRTASHYAPAERHGRIEDWPGLRRELNDAEGTYQSDRAALGGGNVSHPGFPSDFGPPTTQPRPRPTATDPPAR